MGSPFPNRMGCSKQRAVCPPTLCASQNLPSGVATARGIATGDSSRSDCEADGGSKRGDARRFISASGAPVPDVPSVVLRRCCEGAIGNRLGLGGHLRTTL